MDVSSPETTGWTLYKSVQQPETKMLYLELWFTVFLTSRSHIVEQLLNIPQDISARMTKLLILKYLMIKTWSGN